MIPADNTTRYGKFLANGAHSKPKCVYNRVYSHTFRLDSGDLTSGSDALFDSVVYDTDILKLIEEGIFITNHKQRGTDKINLDNVHTRMGDYAPGELALAADDTKLIKSAVGEVIAYGKNRQSWLVFCAGVEHARHVTDEFKTAGRG